MARMDAREQAIEAIKTVLVKAGMAPEEAEFAATAAIDHTHGVEMPPLDGDE